MHLADASIQSNLKGIQAINIFCQYIYKVYINIIYGTYVFYIYTKLVGLIGAIFPISI